MIMKGRLYYIIPMLIIVLFLTAGCAKKEIVSDITIDDFESKAVKEINDEGKLIVTETEDGYKFVFDQYGEDQSWFTGTERFEGIADKDRRIKSVTAMRDNVNTEYFMEMTTTDLVADISDYEKVPVNKLYGEMFLLDFGRVVGLFSPDAESDDQFASGLTILMNARHAPQTINGWKYTIEAAAEKDSVMITAEYVGK